MAEQIVVSRDLNEKPSVCRGSALSGVARADDLGSLGTEVHQIAPCPDAAAAAAAASIFSLVWLEEM